MRTLLTTLAALALFAGTLPTAAAQSAGGSLYVPGRGQAGLNREGTGVSRDANANPPRDSRRVVDDVVTAVGALGGGVVASSANTAPSAERAAQRAVNAVGALGGGAAGPSVRQGSNVGRYESTTATRDRR